MWVIQTDMVKDEAGATKIESAEEASMCCRQSGNGSGAPRGKRVTDEAELASVGMSVERRDYTLPRWIVTVMDAFSITFDHAEQQVGGVRNEGETKSLSERPYDIKGKLQLTLARYYEHAEARTGI